MKTTIDIADPILRRAKRLAARRGTTLRVLVEEALRDKLEAEAEAEADVAGVETHTVRGRGLQPGVSWDDVRTLRDLAYEGRGT
jgi:predicted transcriptional regulator